MKYSKYSGSGKGLGERARKKKKRKPISGNELRKLIAKNKALEQDLSEV